MIELVALNVALFLVLCGLPRRRGTARPADRRTAKNLLRASHRTRATLGAPLAGRARRVGRVAWSVFEPRLLAGLPRGAARAAVAVPALAIAALAVGGAAVVNDVPVAAPDARACVTGPEQGRMTGPEHERMTTPASAGYLTET